MSSFELVIRLKYWQHLLIVTTNETVAEIKKRIESICRIDLSNGEYVLEIYDTKLEDYIVLTERYLMELIKSLSTTATTIQRFKARLEPLNRKEDRPLVFAGYRRYVIVWLDKHIGRPQQYSSLKRVLNSMVDANGASRSTSDEQRDLENLIRLEGEPVHATIHFFDKSDDCLTFIRQNAASIPIFFVTSPGLGRIIAPLIVDQVYAIYVLCTVIEANIDWAVDHIGHIQLFDFDTDLFIRLTRDIADYCMKKGVELLKDDDPKQALEYFSNARKLSLRANTIDGRKSDSRLYNICDLLQLLTPNQMKCSQCEEA